ncbi:MAG: peptidylprolyl isomerase [Bryobacteraceae bacterium]|jgi:peptidyl-prolyl cis-trans isomerase C
MKFFRMLSLLTPMACLLAQTPPPAPSSQAPKAATPVPAGNVVPLTLRPGNANTQVLPAVTVPPDKVVLTVDDVKFTAAQMDRLMSQVKSGQTPAARKQFADTLVKMLVLAEEGRRRKLDQAAAYRDQVALQTSNILAGMTYAEIAKESKPPDEELRKYYDGHKNDFEQVQARHILIRFQGSSLPVKPGQKDLTDAEALAKAQDIRQKLVAGGDFAAIAKQESDDTGSGANGGELGLFRHGQMVPSFETAAFALKEGEISDPVKSQFGYHIIQVEAHKLKTFEEAKPEIEQKMAPQQAQKTLEEMAKKASVDMDKDYFGTAAPALPPSLLRPASPPPKQ